MKSRIRNLGRTLQERLAAFIRVIGQLPGDRRIVLECTRVAIRELLPKEQRSGIGVTPALAAQVIDRARAILRENDLLAEHDAERLDNLLALACRYLLLRYDPKKAGQDVWWKDEDLEGADARLRGLLSNERIDVLTSEARSHEIAVDAPTFRTALSLSWVAALKDILTIGKVRVTAVEGALRWLALPSRRSFVAILLRTLRELGVIECTDSRYGPGFARRYAVAGLSFALPFVVNAVGDQRRQAETAMAARLMEQNAAAYQAMLDRVQTLVKTPLRYSLECLAVSSLPQGEGNWLAGDDDGYSAAMDELEAEIHAIQPFCWGGTAHPSARTHWVHGRTTVSGSAATHLPALAPRGRSAHPADFFTATDSEILPPPEIPQGEDEDERDPDRHRFHA